VCAVNLRNVRNCLYEIASLGKCLDTRISKLSVEVRIHLLLLLSGATITSFTGISGAMVREVITLDCFRGTEANYDGKKA
jgi:hypothetical protein